METADIQRIVGHWTELARARASAFLYERDLARELTESLTGAALQRATVLVGPRRVGKSIALVQAQRRLEALGIETWYCDLTDPRLHGVELRRLIEALGLDRPGAETVCLLVDEIHYAPEWARDVKVLVDWNPKLRLAIADSSSALLETVGREEGVGRWRVIEASPLSFPEWLELQAAEGMPVPRDARGRQEECDRYLRLGGFPELAREPSLLMANQRLREDVVMRALRDDAVQVHRIRDVEGLERLARWLLRDSGVLYRPSEAARESGTSRQTLPQWERAVFDTMLVWPLFLHARSPRKAARKPYKVYAVDPGLVTAFTAGGHRSTDAELMGRLVETACAQALRVWARRADAGLGFWERPGKRRTRYEKDFLIDRGDGLCVVEVNLGGQAERKAREVAAAMRELGASRGCVVAHVARPTTVSSGELEVAVVPLHDMLTRLGGARGEVPEWPTG